MEPVKECSMNRPAFFRKAYHNMRNPIVVVKGYTALMLEGCGGELTDDQREWIEDMKINAEYLLTLINNLSELSFIEAGIGETETVPFDVVKIIKELIEEKRPDFLNKKIEPGLSFPETSLIITADKSLISRAIGSLIHNSLTYCPANSTLQIEAKEEKEHIIISVHDNGPGIERDMTAQIMEGLAKSESPDYVDYRGTGLGLKICSTIAALYGGDLKVESTAGEGSTFILSLRK